MIPALLLAGAIAAPALKANFDGTSSDPSGSFKYYGYAATTIGTKPVPLIVALHGCLEDPFDFEAGTRWYEDAQANGYVVVMPSHSYYDDRNPNRCFQYWDNHDRGKGEPAALVGLVKNIEQKFPIDPNRVYVTGFSSGGAMAVALAADYPEVFAAIGVDAGIEYQPCANNYIMRCAYALAQQDQAQDPASSGKAAYAQDAYTKPIPGIFIHGDTDSVVTFWNLSYAVTSFAVMNDGFTSKGTFPGTFNATAAQHTTDQVPGGYTFDTYVADSGLLTWIVVHGMDHAWSGGVNERAALAADGKNYNDPAGPNATVLIRTFLFAHPRT